MAQYVSEILKYVYFGLLKSKNETQSGSSQLIYIPQPHLLNGCFLESPRRPVVGREKRGDKREQKGERGHRRGQREEGGREGKQGHPRSRDGFF